MNWCKSLIVFINRITTLLWAHTKFFIPDASLHRKNLEVINLESVGGGIHLKLVPGRTPLHSYVPIILATCQYMPLLRQSVKPRLDWKVSDDWSNTCWVLIETWPFAVKVAMAVMKRGFPYAWASKMAGQFMIWLLMQLYQERPLGAIQKILPKICAMARLCCTTHWWVRIMKGLEFMELVS